MPFDDVYMGSNVNICRRDGQCTVFSMKNESGEGTMTVHEVFPGIVLLYNDFHMESCYSEFQTERDMFTIEHCREGRIEWNMGNDAYLYLGAGDLRVDNHRNHNGSFEFPLRHYHGISISLYGKEAEKSLETALNGFPVSIKELQKKFCQRETSFVLRSQSAIEHIFSELYAVPGEIKQYYFKIKVLELLLYLSALDISGRFDEHPYFYKAQVEKIKSIEKFMTSNIEKHYTLNELSDRFDIALTSMKNCFKGVYGKSIYAYMRDYRINRAADMLRKSKESVVSIAGFVGYDSHSKFSVAFKDIMGKSPLEYRKSIV